MTKQDIVELWQGLNKVRHLTGVKFAYAVAKNINILKPEVTALEEAEGTAKLLAQQVQMLWTYSSL